MYGIAGSYAFACRLRSRDTDKWELEGLRMRPEEFYKFVSWLPDATDMLYFGGDLKDVIQVGEREVGIREAR